MKGPSRGTDHENPESKRILGYFGQTREKMLKELNHHRAIEHPGCHLTEGRMEWLLDCQMKTWTYSVGLWIIGFDPEGNPDQLGLSTAGSGVLVEISGQYFIATCAHIFSGVPDRRFWVLPQQMVSHKTEPHEYLPSSQVRWCGSPTASGRDQKSDPSDLALIQVRPNTFLENGHSFYRLDKPVQDLDQPYDGWGCGVPGALTQRSLRGSTITNSGGCTCIPISLSTEPVWSERWERDRRILTAHVDHRPYLRKEEVLPCPDSFQGVSGGGLWLLTDAEPLLVGILVRETPTRLEAVNINLMLEFAKLVM